MWHTPSFCRWLAMGKAALMNPGDMLVAAECSQRICLPGLWQASCAIYLRQTLCTQSLLVLSESTLG